MLTNRCSDVLPDIQHVRSHWQPFAFPYILGGSWYPDILISSSSYPHILIPSYPHNLLPPCPQPSPGKLFIPALCRLIFIPLFLLCNYRPSGVERLWPVSFFNHHHYHCNYNRHHHCFHDYYRHPGSVPLGRPLLVLCHSLWSLRWLHGFLGPHVLPQVITIIVIIRTRSSEINVERKIFKITSKTW